jgi:hypothetical protein
LPLLFTNSNTLGGSKMNVSAIARVLCLSIMFSAIQATAQAQATVNSDLKEMALQIVTREQVLPTVRDGSTNSPQASVEPQFVLLGSTTGGVSGKARVGWIPRNNILVDAIVSGPISNGEAHFASLDGLGNNVSVQFRGQYAWKSTDAGTAAERYSANARAEARVRITPNACGSDNIDKAICLVAARTADNLIATRASNLTRGAGSFDGDRSAIRNAILARTDVTVRNAGDNRRRDAVDLQLSVSELQDAFASEWRRSLRNGEVKTSTAILVSGSFLTANQGFSFVDPTTLAGQRASEVGRTGEVGVGIAKTRGSQPLFYVGSGYEWGTSYEGQPKTELCQPFVASALRCQAVAVGGPSKEDVNRLTLEGRAWVMSSKLAVSARYLRDIDADANTVEFPVYFLRNAKDIEADPSADSAPALTGGVTAGWQDVGGNRDFYAYFFVGTVLGIPGLR